MECFIKKIFKGSVNEETHRQFVRFGKGVYSGRAIITLHKTTKVKLKGSFEYANDFVNLVAELGDVEFSGIVISKEALDPSMFGKIKWNEKRKAGAYNYEIHEGLTSEIVKELAEKAYVMLLNVNSENIKLKIKKKLPKPGKSESKIDDKFCQLEADLKYYSQIKEIFFWDVPDCKKVKAMHTYEIDSLKMPENEKDPVKIRLLTKRIGKLTRKLEIDKNEQIKEISFEA